MRKSWAFGAIALCVGVGSVCFAPGCGSPDPGDIGDPVPTYKGPFTIGQEAGGFPDSDDGAVSTDPTDATPPTPSVDAATDARPVDAAAGG